MEEGPSQSTGRQIKHNQLLGKKFPEKTIENNILKKEWVYPNDYCNFQHT